MRKFLSCAAVCGLLLAVQGSPVIVTSSGAAGAEKTAAAELAEHLSKILGKKVPVVREGTHPVSGRRIFVGKTVFAAKHGLGGKFQPEESRIKSCGKDLIITGGRPRGTLYGVYEFLERTGKVAWLDEKTTVIPADPGLMWENLDIRVQPSFRYRGIYTTPTWSAPDRSARLKFLARSRENVYWEWRLTPQERERWGISPVLGRPAPLNTMHYYSVLWPKKGMETARSLNLDGKRDFSKSYAGPGQICFSSPLARKRVAEQMLEFIALDRKDFPDMPPVLYNLSINDTHDRCECKACVGKAQKYGSYAGTVLEFVNFVADRIKPVYPEIRIQTSAYLFTEKTPEGIKPRSNVIVRLSPSPWGSQCQTMVPLDAPVNRKTLDDMKKWSRAGAIQLWNYWVIFGNAAGRNAGITGIPAMISNLKIFKELGSDYVFSECEFPDTASFHSLRVYLGYQLLRDPFQRADWLVSRFFAAYFGPTAEAMKNYYDYLHRRQAEAPSRDTNDAALRPQLDAAFFRYADKCFAAAEKAAAGRKEYLDRICLEQVSLDIARLSVRTLKTDLQAAARLKKNWQDALKRHYGKVPPREAEAFKQFFRKIMPPEKGCRYPLPEELASRVKYDIAWPDFAAVKNLASFGVALKEDPQSPCRKAMCIARPLRMPEKGFHSKVLQAGVFSRTAKKAQVTKIFRVKTDEKYHWYTLGEVKLDPVSILYVHRSWFLQHLLDRYYMPGEDNRYEIRVSLKAAGPAYSPGSTAENVLWLDRVLLLAPAGK